MHPAGFEPAIPAGKRTQTHALDRSATGIFISPFDILRSEKEVILRLLNNQTWEVRWGEAFIGRY